MAVSLLGVAAMNLVRCSKCLHPIPDSMLSGHNTFACPRCDAALEVLIFPAINRQAQTGAVAERAVVEGETTCFFHSEKKATVVCNGCGRFLCALCDVALDNEHLCPKCIEAGRTKKTLTTFETYRTSYPSLALTLQVVPLVLALVMWPLTIITAPAGIFLIIYGWRKPISITGRRKIVITILALLLAIGQCLAWVAGIFGLYTAFTTRG